MTETRFRQKHTALMTCRVTLSIHADPERVWRLLTDAKADSREGGAAPPAGSGY